MKPTKSLHQNAMITTNDIRTTFLDFFANKQHEILPSSSLVPHNDPTLMFTNAGMNQFKNMFTGAQQPTHQRIATSQKCVRAGGKHNDLDNVGYTARHHTFFEMLGNFSFGDYFKEAAIEYAWELLTKIFGLPTDKLYVTIYHTDDEAFSIWKQVTSFADHKILRVPTKDNFWQMGDSGPCGPCSEIFYDHGPDTAQGEWQLNSDGSDRFGDRFIEIWNLVFMQFDRQNDGSDIPLPKPSIDTGMGLERIAAVLQGKHNNYDIDLFQHIISSSVELTGKQATGEYAASHRVIADHLRSSCFLMADGVLPSNEGRGYVLRRIMRRAMRHAHILGASEPLLYKLVPSLIEQMGQAYPELERAKALITENLRSEEERFQTTLARGLKLLDEETSKLAAGSKLSGEIAFKLYDTYGFPLDLTQDILRNRNISVDISAFNQAMEEQKARARAAWSGSGESKVNTIWLKLLDEHGDTEFIGYDNNQANAKLLAIIVNDKICNRLCAGQEGFLLFNQTVFYAESGGQLGDIGEIFIDDKLAAIVTDTKKPVSGLHAHKVIAKQNIEVGNELLLKIDEKNRSKLRANHSATHLLNAALRQVLGEHITQKGSEVAADKLRFDISHNKALTAEQIRETEHIVNQQIWHNSPVITKIMPRDKAIESGATAIFGEKYADEVRVLAMGYKENNSSNSDNAFSIELCGGTHVKRTGDIGLFKIISESALAAGVRRIEAITQEEAFNYMAKRCDSISQLAQNMKTTAEQLPERIINLQNEKKKLEKEISNLKKKLAVGGKNGTAPSFAKENINGITFAYQALEDIPPKDLRDIANEILQKIKSGVVAIATNFSGKAGIVVAISKDLTTKLNSVELIQAATPKVDGKGGGGRPEMAQGGGPSGSKINNALQAIAKSLQEKLG